MSAEVSDLQEEAPSEVLSEERDTTAAEFAPGADAESSADDLPLDVVFGALKNARRRRVLRYLDDHREPVSLSDLAEHVAAIENDTSPENLTAKQRKRVYIVLYQCHLPKLDDMGFITFDKNRGRIERSPAASKLDRYLHIDDSDTRPWHRYYMGFLLLGTGTLLLGAVTGIGESAGATMLFLGVCIGIAGIAALQTYDRREDSWNSLTEIASLRSQLRSRFSKSQATGSDDKGDKPTEETTNSNQLLQKCPECSEVYVSATHRECQSCKTMTIATGTGD